MSATRDDRNKQLIAFLLSIVGLGRLDYHGLLRNSQSGRATYARSGLPVTEENIQRHLGGQEPLDIYPMKGSETQIAVLDFDDHDGTCGFEKIKSAVVEVARRLQIEGLRLLIVRSGGGKGVHIWMFWLQSQPASTVREYLRRRFAR
jgi:hypothetical protein